MDTTDKAFYMLTKNLHEKANLVLNASEHKWVEDNRQSQDAINIKSKARVRDLAEVLTNVKEINKIVELIDVEEYKKDSPSKKASYIPFSFRSLTTFLEPAVGDGNFIVVILSHKLASLLNQNITGNKSLAFEITKIISSIYAIDIDESNVIATRNRIKHMLSTVHKDYFIGILSNKEYALMISNYIDPILNVNIIHGDSLSDLDFSKTDKRGKHGISFHEFIFDDKNMSLDFIIDTYAKMKKEPHVKYVPFNFYNPFDLDIKKKKPAIIKKEAETKKEVLNEFEQPTLF